MVFISRHVLNNTLPSHVCVCVKLLTCNTRNETSVETTRDVERSEMNSTRFLGGAQ